DLFHALRPQGLNALADAVRLNTDGLRSVRVLLFVHRKAWSNKLLLLRALDSAGNPTGFDQTIDPDSSRQIQNLADLPSEWSDPARPWMQLVEGVWNAWFQVFSRSNDLATPVLFEAGLPAGTKQLEIGLETDFQAQAPNWGLLIIEGQTEA